MGRPAATGSLDGAGQGGVVLIALNLGSSSAKLAAFDADGTEIGRGEIAGRRLAMLGAGMPPLDAVLDGEPFAAALAVLERERGREISAVGHRVVHGGERFTEAVRVDDGVLSGIEALTKLAPLHQPPVIAAIRALRAARAELVQIACFDTAFHAGMPEVARRIALPPELGLRRYGFHGLSYEFIARRLAETEPGLAAGRVIVAHLGSGASLCALYRGRSIETSMSMTALDGLVMATRPGSLDPGAVLYLQQALGMSAQAIETLLYRGAGLAGLTGTAGDVRALLGSAEPAAAAALELFVYRAVQLIGGLVAVLGGLDGLVFTGGIGAHAEPIRARIMAGLGWLPAFAERVMATDEEAMMARHMRDIIGRDVLWRDNGARDTERREPGHG